MPTPHRTPHQPLDAPLAAHPLAAEFERSGLHDFPDEPLYGVLMRLVARSAEWLALLDSAPATQRRSTLLLASLHHRLLCARQAGTLAHEPLAAWFASVTPAPRPPMADAALAQALHHMRLQHHAALRLDLATRRTQTNETGRCTVLRAALSALAARHGGAPLALFDLGCSAGLNLAVDSLAVHYTPAEAALAGLAPRSAAPTPPAQVLHALVLGPQAVPGAGQAQPFTLADRLGTDQAVVDVRDPDALRWLQACLWPSDALRRQRLDHAVAVFRAARGGAGHPLQQADDALALLPGWLARLPAGVVPVLFNSWVLAYFSAADLATHTQRVYALLRQHPALCWLSAEDGPRTQATTGLALPDEPLPGLAAGPHAVLADSLATICTYWSLSQAAPHDPASVSAQLLARSHPHGHWLEWRAG